MDPSGHSGGISDFLQGVVYELTSNTYDGLLIPSNSPLRQDAEDLAVSQTDNVAFQGGRIVGGAVSAVQGALEIGGGTGLVIGGLTGGIVTSPTGAGAVAGGAVAAAGAAVAVHGAGTFFNGVVGASEATQNIVNAITGSGGGRHSRTIITRDGWQLTDHSLERAEQRGFDLDVIDDTINNWDRYFVQEDGREVFAKSIGRNQYKVVITEKDEVLTVINYNKKEIDGKIKSEQWFED